MTLRNTMMGILSKLPSKDIALMYSGGYDSFAILVTLMDMGISPTLYTFYLDGVESDDIKMARRDAKIFGMTLVEVKVPSDMGSLKSDVRRVIAETGCSKKTVVQCCHPMMYIADAIKEHVVLQGILADSFYGTTRKGAIAGRKSLEEFNKFRDSKFYSTSHSSVYIKRMFESRGFEYFDPYKTEEMREFFKGKTFEECNKPHAKQPMYECFYEEIEKSGGRKKENFQVGSGIRELHDRLLSTDMNTGGWKSVVGIYNKIRNELS